MKKIIHLLFLGLYLTSVAVAQQGKALTAAFDSVARKAFPASGPGASILVRQGGKVLYKNAFGQADLEEKIPMRTDHVFRIASLTKQFTAIAVLQLMEAGRLSLDDAVTKHIPGYPAHGSSVTVEHLLTHTSGIRDYAGLPDTLQRGRTDLQPAALISIFKDLPLRFAPGSRYEYSNSNYALLGYMIEQVTGQRYADYLEEHFFHPLGMVHTYYANDTTLIQNRAAGYTRGSKGFLNAPYLSMTHPYAAGSLLSTVEDLAKWQQALQAHRLVKKETLDRAYTRYRLSGGQPSDYGYGFRLGYIQESPSIWHGGLINGFKSISLYLPDGDVHVVVLTNWDGSAPEGVAARLAAIAIGKPYAEREVLLPEATLQGYTGSYQNAAGDQVVITSEGSRLFLQRGRGPRAMLKAAKQDHFFFEDPLVTLQFGKDGTGQVEQLSIHSRSRNEVWKKSEQPMETRSELKVDEKLLERYTGRYEVSPQFSFVITREAGQLYLQAEGQEQLPLFAEAPHKFYLKVNDATLEFVKEGEQVTKALLKQGGRAADAIKVQ